jgi:hypothetical protein
MHVAYLTELKNFSLTIEIVWEAHQPMKQSNVSISAYHTLFSVSNMMA